MTDSTNTTSLSATTLASLRVTFQAGAHWPSDSQWAAIKDLADHLQKAAEDGVDAAVYLSAIPAGTGKSATLAAFAAALCVSPAHAHVGMLILCNRVTEVEDMAMALQAYRDRLCIICGDTTVQDLGDHLAGNDAQIVIATQASLKMSLRDEPDFRRLGRFHFNGTPRAVRCWDEAYAMRRPVIIDADDINGLSKFIRRQSDPAAIALGDLAAQLNHMKEDGPCTVPDFEALGVDFRALKEVVEGNDDLSNLVHAFRDISGRSAWAHRDNSRGPVMLRHNPELPPSLMPIVVTDASAALGVNHEAYVQMEQSGMPLRRLREAPKTYHNLHLRIVPIAASRSVYTDKASSRGLQLIEMAVRYIRSVAPMTVLIISYKRTSAPLVGVKEKTIEAAINARLTESERENVRHLTWGQHTATNKYADVRHILLMGLNFVPRVSSYAESSALLGKSMNTANPDDHPTTGQINAIRDGNLRDSTLQAILRGAARKGVHGDCGTCEVVIPQTKQTGLSLEDYEGMFPGSVIQTDTSLMPRKALRGRVAELEGIILGLQNAGHREFPNSALRETMKLDEGSFRRLVRHSDWKMAMGWHGLVPQRLTGGLSGMRFI